MKDEYLDFQEGRIEESDYSMKQIAESGRVIREFGPESGNLR